MGHEAGQGIRVVTVTVSDSRTAASDVSGSALDELLVAGGCVILRHRFVRDEVAYIQELVRTEADHEGDVVVLTGGTGITPRDVTIEALEGIFEKRLDGFGEAFRRLSWDEIGPRSILSRATAGVVKKTLVVALPGSTAAVRLAVEKVLLPVIQHAVDLATGRHTHHGKS